ncbi:cell wall protein [Trichoderma novae-zelandiae]
MKVSVVSLLLAGLVAAQDFSGQPDCAIPCLKDAIPKAGCALTDTACACKPDVQAKLVGLVGPCLLSKCSPSDLAKAQAAAADACKNNAGGSTEIASDATTTATEPSSETTASATESTTEATTTTDAGTTSEATTAPASTTSAETTVPETTVPETTAPETTTAASTGASVGPTIQPPAPSGVSNSTVSGTRSVITRTSTAFVGGDDGGSRTSGVPASTTLAGSDATAPIAGVLGAVLAALMAL